MSAGRKVWVKIRASEAERTEWHAKARAVGLSLSDLVRRSVGRVRTPKKLHRLAQALMAALSESARHVVLTLCCRRARWSTCLHVAPVHLQCDH